MGETASTGTFRVIGKAMRRANIVPLQMGMRADGSPNIVQQPGELETLPVGTELTNVTEQELQAFGDRLAPVDDAAKAALAKVRGGAAEPAEGATEAEPGPYVAGAPSSPADTPGPPQAVWEDPALAAAQAEGARAAASRGGRGAPGQQPSTPAGPSHQPSTPGGTPSHPEATPPGTPSHPTAPGGEPSHPTSEPEPSPSRRRP